MKDFNEFKARFESDAEFREQFKGINDDNQIISLAKANGYDLEKFGDDTLDEVSGGIKYRNNINPEIIEDIRILRNMFF